jgi:hypothetical protein
MAQQLRMSLHIALNKRTKKQIRNEKKILKKLRRIVSEVTAVPAWYLEFLKLPMKMEKDSSRNTKHSFDVKQFISLHQNNWEYHLQLNINDCLAKKATKICKKHKLAIQKKLP